MYGLTLEQYAQMYQEQDGCCAICDVRAARLDVDHDHKSGEVRKLLCGPCNRMLGLARESSATLYAAAAYLAMHNAPNELATYRARALALRYAAK